MENPLTITVTNSNDGSLIKEEVFTCSNSQNHTLFVGGDSDNAERSYSTDVLQAVGLEISIRFLNISSATLTLDIILDGDFNDFFSGLEANKLSSRQTHFVSVFNSDQALQVSGSPELIDIDYNNKSRMFSEAVQIHSTFL